MTPSRGIFTFQIGEGEEKKEIGFKFGMRASEITEQEAKKLISEVFESITEKKADFTTCLLNYFYGAGCSFAESKKLTPPERNEVADWLDAIGYVESVKVFTTSVLGPESPNPEAPNQEGQN